MRRLVLAAMLAAGLAGCVSAPMSAPDPTLDNIQAIRSGALAPMTVGAFVAGPQIRPEADRSLAVRADVLKPPEGSFARYLGATLASELKGAGKYDPASHLVVSGVMTASHVDSALPQGHAVLGATFTLARDGQVVLAKPLSVEDTFDSALLGVEAIPQAENHYLALYAKLVGRLLTDPEFRAAAKP